jgi:tRNA threonylcarbamoyladenosine biosynthesis protein TsaB
MTRRRLVALDTSADSGSMALVEDGRVVEEVEVHSTDGFAHVLFGRLGELLSRQGWSLESVGCFAAAAGPGSFTGVRVGLSAVKGLADVLERPVVGVSNLRALASYGAGGGLRCALLDARRGEVYSAVYDASGGLVGEETVGTLEVRMGGLPAGEAIEFVSATPGLFAGVAGITEAPKALAGAIGRIAFADWDGGGAVDPVVVDANYVRRSDAELFWKDR